MKRLLLYLTVIIAVPTQAQECLFDQKPVQDLVQDYANVLSDAEEQTLRQALIRFDDTTSTQILLVTVTDLCGYDKAEFTYTLGEKWGVGSSEFNNGLVIMVKPKEIDGKGEAYIATGYGLEGVLPDATAKQIIEKEMIPHFKNKEYYEGIHAAANVAMEIVAGEYSAGDYRTKDRWKAILVFAIFIGLFIFFIINKAGRARKYANTNGMTFWAAWSLLNASRGSHGGSYGDFSSGGGSFGGFGGGSFGGGGAGGSW
ncbi:MAG: TPM domain-containing protein [Flavobacteriales bacterium]|nr:TPM domain-containing protein [Flavobacteriales bacterium]